jgi:hypothetical protein
VIRKLAHDRPRDFEGLQAGWSEHARIRALQTALMRCPIWSGTDVRWTMVPSFAAEGSLQSIRHVPPLRLGEREFATPLVDLPCK